MKFFSFSYFLKLVTGLVLLFWAYKNLFPVEWFEYRLVEQNLANWYFAPVLARVVISLRFIVGAFLILNINPKNTLPKLLIVLLLLSVYDFFWQVVIAKDLILDFSYSYLYQENLFLNIGINLLLMAVAIYLAIKNEPADLNLKWVKYVFGSVLFVLPFILNPVFPDDFEDVSTRVDEPFDTASVVSPKLKQLSEGKIFIAYFSVNCPFCLNAARKIAIAQKQHKNFPAVYVCMLGNQEQTDYFFDRANAKFDCDVMNSKDYSTLTHFAFPMFSWVEKGRVIRKWDGRTFNYGAMTEFCNWKKPE